MPEQPPEQTTVTGYDPSAPIEEQGGLRKTWWRSFGPAVWHIGASGAWLRIGPLSIAWSTDTGMKRFARLDKEAARAKS